jgi:2-haloacid dehalogenase
MPLPALAVALDVNETLFSMDRMAARLPPGALPTWFARVLRDGFALTVTGDAPRFRDLALTHLAPFTGDPEGVLAEFGRLDPHPDVRPALEALRDAGVPAVTLTNGSSDPVRAMFAGAGLQDLVQGYLSVDDVGVWKPRPEPYHHAADHLGVPRDRLALIAVHGWDVHGAKRAGLLAGWCSRLEGALLPQYERPDVTGDTLVEVVDGLLGGGR